MGQPLATGLNLSVEESTYVQDLCTRAINQAFIAQVEKLFARLQPNALEPIATIDEFRRELTARVVTFVEVSRAQLPK